MVTESFILLSSVQFPNKFNSVNKSTKQLTQRSKSLTCRMEREQEILTGIQEFVVYNAGTVYLQ